MRPGYGDDFQMLEVQNSEEAARLVIKNYLREVAIHGIENVQILSPFRKRGAVASNALNETIRDLVNPPNNLKKEVKCGSRVFRVGDRIMQTVNRINVSNGDVGIITDVETEDDDTIARVKLLDGRELSYTQEMLEDLEFSYCTTIHKSQGQEYPVIIRSSSEGALYHVAAKPALYSGDQSQGKGHSDWAETSRIYCDPQM